MKEALIYHFTPSAILSNFVPLIVIFESDKEKKMLDFEYKMWNTLQIYWDDTQETSNIKELIQEYASSCEAQEHIYMYGEAEAAHGVVRLATLCNVHTIHANFSPTQQDKRTDKIFRLKKVLDLLEKM